jgi:NUMOD4 motif/HNH endonuclease
MPKRGNTRERWRPVIGFAGLYTVSTQGRVFSIRAGKFLKQFPQKDRLPSRRYMRVSLRAGGIRKQFSVHRLVLMAFRGLPREGQQTRHLDGSPRNNAVYNLVYGTRAEDFADRLRHGRGLKLNPKRVLQIRRSSESNRTLAVRFGCSINTVRKARTGLSWAYIPGGFYKTQIKLTPRLIRYIRASDKTQRTLAAELGCDRTTVGDVRNYRSWADVT